MDGETFLLGHNTAARYEFQSVAFFSPEVRSIVTHPESVSGCLVYMVHSRQTNAVIGRQSKLEGMISRLGAVGREDK